MSWMYSVYVDTKLHFVSNTKAFCKYVLGRNIYGGTLSLGPRPKHLGHVSSTWDASQHLGNVPGTWDTSPRMEK